MFFGLSILAVSVALAAGYIVLTKAKDQSGFLAKLGQIIGWLIIIISVSGLICASANIGKHGRHHGMSNHKPKCENCAVKVEKKGCHCHGEKEEASE